MRPPRPGSGWSAGRVLCRGRYAAYIDSPDWFARRERWHATHLVMTGQEPVCAVCGRPWRLRDDDLHHATYARLGDEAYHDLVPMCREHHTALHNLWDASLAWRPLGRAQATAGIIAVLRRRQNDRPPREEHPA